MRLTGYLLQKFFRKLSNFFLYFPDFFEMFPVEKDGFFAVSSWGRMVFEIYAYPFGYFLALKIDEILTHFTLGSPYDFAYLVFFSSQPSAQVFAKHGFASVYQSLSALLAIFEYFQLTFSPPVRFNVK